MPKQGEEYVMFLRSDSESPGYEILAAYAVNGGKVESLDGISLLREGEPLSSYKLRLQFNGTDINEFLDTAVREVGTNK
jgi:hypothetical protein